MVYTVSPITMGNVYCSCNYRLGYARYNYDEYVYTYIYIHLSHLITETALPSR